MLNHACIGWDAEKPDKEQLASSWEVNGDCKVCTGIGEIWEIWVPIIQNRETCRIPQITDTSERPHIPGLELL